MSNPQKINRREALKLGLGTAAGLLGGKLMAADNPKKDCSLTPAEEAGPFYPTKDQPDKDVDLTVVQGAAGRAEGKVIVISGQVLDENCQPVAGALVEIWQANKWGRYAHEGDTNPAPLDPNFQGRGMAITDAEGRYSFKTIFPGTYPATPEWTRTPHIHFKVSRRGYHELITQMYFEGQPLNETDLLIKEMPKKDVQRLIVKLTGDGDDPHGIRHGHFDIHIKQVV